MAVIMPGAWRVWHCVLMIKAPRVGSLGAHTVRSTEVDELDKSLFELVV